MLASWIKHRNIPTQCTVYRKEAIFNFLVTPCIYIPRSFFNTKLRVLKAL